MGLVNGFFFLKVAYFYDKRKIFRFLSHLLKKMLIKNNYKLTVFSLQSESKLTNKIFDKFIDFRFSMKNSNLEIFETGIITYNLKIRKPGKSNE